MFQDYSQRLFQIINLVFSIIFIIGVSVRCAEPSAPQGGPTDKQAPRISTKQYSTPNPSTNFKDKRIILTFDEWIKLQSAYNQVIMSPPLEEKPEVKIRNKSVVVQWKEALKDSTTYIINFGDAVRDITEGNIVPNLKMVFSTGSVLDSLICTGQIVDASTRMPKAGVFVLLYRNLADSVPLTQKPYYFSKTDAQGVFKIEYIKEGRYRIFALDDKNSNYKYDLATEEIGFLDSSFLINNNLQPALRISTFKEKEATRVQTNNLLHYGCLFLTYNNKIQSPTQIELLDAPADFKSYVQQSADTAFYWFDGSLPETGKWTFIVRNETEKLLDTIRVSAVSKSDFKTLTKGLDFQTAIIAPNTDNRNAKPLPKDTATIPQNPFLPITVSFNSPVIQRDSSKILILKDNVPIKDLKISQSTKDLNRLYLNFKKEKKARYQLLILPEALTDFWGTANPDTLSKNYQLNSEEDFGTIKILLKGMNPNIQYIAQLLDSKGIAILKQTVNNSSEAEFLYKNAKTGEYTILVIHDEIPNGIWDVGNYSQNRQAEKITSSQKFLLNPGWENTMEIDLSSE